jgi:serine/threonine-protein kinase
MTDDQADRSERPMLGGRYEPHRRIARGGMAEVFLARDQVLERLVAVKVLFPKFAHDPRFVTRFRREASAVAKLNHANIVRVYDWGAHDDTYFIVMEYVEGESLAELVARGPLGVSRAVEIASAAAAGLGYAHAGGVVHRDIKPGNILLAATRGVKVTDFGVARARDGGESLTETGKVMGTAAYFSPEQAQGHDVGPPSDLYSLGVVLFEMVTGRPPFAGGSPAGLAHQHVYDRPPPARTLDPSVPADLEALIDRLLAKNPDDRYRSASELEADLERLASGQPLRLGMAGDGRPAPAPGGGQATAAFDHGQLPATQAMPASARHGPITHKAGRRARRSPSRGGAFVVVMTVVLLAAIAGLVYVSRFITDDASDDPPPTATSEAPAAGGDASTTASTATSAPPATETPSTATTAPATSESTTTTTAPTTASTVQPTSGTPAPTSTTSTTSGDSATASSTPEGAGG